MKKIKNYSNLTNLASIRDALHGFGAGRALFLDIETTGFSAAKASLYLIGAAYLEDDHLVMEQFFADDPSSLRKDAANTHMPPIPSGSKQQVPSMEYDFEIPELEDSMEEIELLMELSHLCRRLDFDTIVTFHGLGFDLPFLKGCVKRLGLDPDICAGYDNKYYVDLYKTASSYRHIFQLQNYKQHTLETFFGIDREHVLSGGDLIKVYKKYRSDTNNTSEQLLLQHNREDVLGMVRLLDLYAYQCFFEGDFVVVDTDVSKYRRMDNSDGQELTIRCLLSRPLPAAISCCDQYFYLHAADTDAVFRIALYEGTLKYFYPNYKDYDYLPDEDMAVHKSVAAYVDRAHRRKASAADCYSRKTGVFLPQLEKVAEPALHMEYKDSVSYFELPEHADGNDIFHPYCLHILRMLKAGK